MLKTRIITALVLIVGFLLILFSAPNMLWSLLMLAATLVGVWEWSNLIKLSAKQTYLYITAAFGIGMLLFFAALTPLAHYAGFLIFVLLASASIFWLVFAPVWLMTRKIINNKLIMAVLGLLVLLATWISLTGLHSISPWLLLAILATVWIADSAAYFSGKRFGRHKLAPAISPGKTWEGVAGGIVAVSFYGYLLFSYLHYSLWLILALWLIVILSIMGDLFESLLKRQAGVKDSSHLLPGHGGVLDRIDGLIPSLPIILICIYTPFFAGLQLHA